MKNIAKRIKEIRERKGISREDLADNLHLSVETLIGYEEGLTKLSTDLISEFAFVDEHGELFIKRLQKVPNGGIKILSDNPHYAPLDFTQEELERCYIMGKLVKALPLHMIDL